MTSDNNKKLTKQEKREKRERAVNLRIASKQLEWIHAILGAAQEDIVEDFPDTGAMSHIQASLDRLKHAYATLLHESERV